MLKYILVMLVIVIASAAMPEQTKVIAQANGCKAPAACCGHRHWTPIRNIAHRIHNRRAHHHHCGCAGPQHDPTPAPPSPPAPKPPAPGDDHALEFHTYQNWLRHWHWELVKTPSGEVVCESRGFNTKEEMMASISAVVAADHAPVIEATSIREAPAKQ